MARLNGGTHEYGEQWRKKTMNIFNVRYAYLLFGNGRYLKLPIPFEEPRSHDMAAPGQQ